MCLEPIIAIEPLETWGLRGRLLTATQADAPDRDILLVYGHGGSLEQICAIAATLSAAGRVRCPDLAGFGGMQPLSAANRPIDIAGLGDHLAHTIESIYGPSGRLSLVGASMGFAVIAQMLERHPEVSRRIDAIVSAAGLLGGRDVRYGAAARTVLRVAARLAATDAIASIMTRLVLGPLGSVRSRRAMQEGSGAQCSRHTDDLLKHHPVSGDWRTRMVIMAEILDSRRAREHQVPLRVTHLVPARDRHLEHSQVVASLQSHFSDVLAIDVPLERHFPRAPTEVSLFFPPGVLDQLFPKRLSQQRTDDVSQLRVDPAGERTQPAPAST